MTKISLQDIGIALLSLALVALTVGASIHVFTVVLGPIPFEASVIMGIFVGIPLVVIEHTVWELLTLFLHERAAVKSLPGETSNAQSFGTAVANV